MLITILVHLIIRTSLVLFVFVIFLVLFLVAVELETVVVLEFFENLYLRGETN